MSTIQLSVLDQSPVRKGGGPEQALKESVELAKLADKLGFTRYWVSEHHNTTSLAGSSPEVLIAHLANHTQTIRLGSGGVMLPNHSALKVAENFRLLEALFPGRIDLGIGRAPGGDRITSYLLNPSNHFKEEDLLDQLEDLRNYLDDKAFFGESQIQVKAIPVSSSKPDLWMLTSSGHSGMLAAQFGMGLSFAHFINPAGGAQVMEKYYKNFQPSEAFSEPAGSVGIFVFCSESEETLMQQRAVMDWQLLNIGKGVSGGFPSYQDIENVVYTEAELETIRFNRLRMIIGKPSEVRNKIEKLAKTYQVHEIVVATITSRFEDRLNSYRLLANEFGLSRKAKQEQYIAS